MKKFRLQCGHVVTVDDADAYLLRSYVWFTYSGTDGIKYIRGRGPGRLPRPLSHVLLDLPTGARVYYKNFDTFDLRRDNLAVVYAGQGVAA